MRCDGVRWDAMGCDTGNGINQWWLPCLAFVAPSILAHSLGQDWDWIGANVVALRMRCAARLSGARGGLAESNHVGDPGMGLGVDAYPISLLMKAVF